MAQENLKLLATGRVPQDRAIVIGSRDHATAVTAQSNAFNRVVVPLEGLEVLAAGHLPKNCSLVIGACGNVFAVTAKGHAADRAGVPCLENEFGASLVGLAVSWPKQEGKKRQAMNDAHRQTPLVCVVICLP